VKLPRKKTSAESIALIEKQAHALQLRKAGKTFDQIAQALGYASPSGAYQAVTSALQATLQEPADDLRRLEVERLNRLFDVAYDKAVDPDQKGAMFAVDRCLAIMDRRAKLLGLDAPIRKTIEIVDDSAIDREIERLVAQLAENDSTGNQGRGDTSETADLPGVETPGS
jgi:hypothetical protein